MNFSLLKTMNNQLIVVFCKDISLRLLIDYILKSRYQNIQFISSLSELSGIYSPNIFLIIFDFGTEPTQTLQAIKTIRQVSKIPIMVIENYTEISDEIHLKALGVNSFLTNPFSRDQLLAEVKKYE